MNKVLGNIDLSIIVPCFNEAYSLEKTIETILHDAKKYLHRFEILIVNDGSSDVTPKIVQNIQSKYSNIYVITHKKNQGLGAAILSGVKRAKFDLITYLPGDGQAYLQDIIEGLKIANGADLVLTYRTNRSDYTLFRKFLSLCLKMLIRLLFGLTYKDYNWVHIYKKHIFTKIKMSTKGVFFLGEIVIKAHDQNLTIRQAESVYRPRTSGTSKTAKLRSVYIAFLDVLKTWYSLRLKKFFYEKRFTLLLIIIHMAFLFPFLQPGIPLSHDGDGHVARIGAYYKAFQDGQIPPRWAGDLNFRFGTPLFIFNYQFPYYVATLLHESGMHLEDTFKFILGLSFIFSGIGFFLWLSKLVRKEAAFFGSLLFGLAPYHFLNVFVRGAFGETVALAIIPFIFFQIEKIRERKSFGDVCIAGILYGLLILSHNGMSLLFSPIFLLYALYRTKNLQTVGLFVAFFLIGLLLSAYFWLPAMLEAKYVVGTKAFTDMFAQHFSPLSYLIFSNWGFGPDVNTQGGLSPQVGIPIILFVVIATLQFFRHREKDIGFWLFLFIVAIFFTTSLSYFFWDKIALLRFLEFPWRFTTLSSLAGAAIGAYIISKIKNNKIIYFIAAFLLVYSFSFTKTDVQNKRDDDYYFSFSGSTVYRRATTTIWTGEDPSEIPKNKIVIIAGNGQISNLQIKSNLHSFTITSETDVRILDSTFYFPGWIVEVDEKKTAIEFQDMNHRGLITFAVPKGRHLVTVSFTETKVRLLADMISLSSIPLVIGFLYSRRESR